MKSKRLFSPAAASPNVIPKRWRRSSLKAMKSPAMVIITKWRAICAKNEERDVIKRTTDMILNRAQKRPFGWRSCTQSPNSLELLLEQGYLWNSNSFSHDLPFVWQNGKKKLVELPRQPFGDGRTYGHRDSGNPNDTLVVWKAMFDQFYEESSLAPTFCPFQFHPYISSRPGRAKTLSDIIGSHEIAQRCVVRHRQRNRALVVGEGFLGRGEREDLEGGVRRNWSL